MTDLEDNLIDLLIDVLNRYKAYKQEVQILKHLAKKGDEKKNENKN